MGKKLYFLIIVIFASTNFGIGTPIYAEDLEPIKLEKPSIAGGKSLMESLSERKSTRSFSRKEIPVDILSNLLWAASGINRPDSGKLTVPSASNRQEIDIYVAMKSGLYVYDPKGHVLKPVVADDIREYAGSQDFTQIAPVNLIYVADFSKMGGDEKNKAFYSATDTGFISQNVYLFSASEGLATVVLGWVDKEKLGKIMNLKKSQRVILAQPVGYPE